MSGDDEWDAIDDVIGDVLNETSNDVLGDAVRTPRVDGADTKMFGFLDDLEQNLSKITLIADEDLNEREANERLGITTQPTAAPVYATASDFQTITPSESGSFSVSFNVEDTQAADEVEKAVQSAMDDGLQSTSSTTTNTDNGDAPAPPTDGPDGMGIIVAPSDDLFALAQAKLMQHREKKKTIKFKKKVPQTMRAKPSTDGEVNRGRSRSKTTADKTEAQAGS